MTDGDEDGIPFLLESYRDLLASLETNMLMW